MKFKKPQKSYKIEFIEKQSILGMPKDRDWALIANYSDNTLMKNYLMYHLSAQMGALYSPKCDFVELYLNKEYLGTYLLTETIKIAKKRINLPQNDSSYIIEVDSKHRDNDLVFFSDVLTANGEGKAFKIHAPKKPTSKSFLYIQDYIQNFESFLKEINIGEYNNIQKWIDIDEFIKYYWLQEFSKNPDTGVNDGFLTSVYFTLSYGEKLKMGPIWDFDLAFGNHTQEKINLTENWHIRKYWFKYLFKDSLFQKKIKEYWKENLITFESTIDSIETYKNKLEHTANNHYKRWGLTSSTNLHIPTTLSPFEENVENLKSWIQKRIQWINNQED